jgi:hypothetical protein
MIVSLVLQTWSDVPPPPSDQGAVAWVPYALPVLFLVVFVGLNALRRPKRGVPLVALGFAPVGESDAVSIVIKPTTAETIYGALASYARMPIAWLSVPLTAFLILSNIAGGGGATWGRQVLMGCVIVLLMPALIVVGTVTNARVRQVRADGFRLSFHETYLESRSPGDAVQLAWPTFKKGWENGSVFALRLQRGVLVVPKRCFATLEDVARVRELLKRNGAIG